MYVGCDNLGDQNSHPSPHRGEMVPGSAPHELRFADSHATRVGVGGFCALPLGLHARGVRVKRNLQCHREYVSKDLKAYRYANRGIIALTIRGTATYFDMLSK